MIFWFQFTGLLLSLVLITGCTAARPLDQRAAASDVPPPPTWGIHWTQVTTSSRHNTADGSNHYSLKLRGQITTPADAKVIAWGPVRFTRLEDDHGLPLVSIAGSRTTNPEPHIDARSFMRDVNDLTVEGEVADLPLPAEKIGRVAGTIDLLVQKQAITRDFPFAALAHRTEILPGFSIQLNDYRHNTTPPTAGRYGLNLAYRLVSHRPAAVETGSLGQFWFTPPMITGFDVIDNKNVAIARRHMMLRYESLSARGNGANGSFILAPGRTVKAIRVNIATQTEWKTVEFDLPKPATR